MFEILNFITIPETEGRELMDGMLRMDPGLRFTMDDVVNHPVSTINRQQYLLSSEKLLYYSFSQVHAGTIYCSVRVKLIYVYREII